MTYRWLLDIYKESYTSEKDVFSKILKANSITQELKR